ncbi:MAG: dihydroorotase [Defluviitaleaceae bacterium]|nr:dihydroorotase [Defluviitaleaceae bacterium]
MSEILICGGRIIDPKNGHDAVADLYVKGGEVAAIGANLSAPGARVINAAGMWVLPGLIDLHVHFRQPGGEHKEDIASGCASAALGGFTTVCAMANTTPTIDNAEIVKKNLSIAKNLNLCNMLQISAITRGLLGKMLVDTDNLAPLICGYSDDGLTIMDTDIYSQIFPIAFAQNLPIFAHCEDLALGADPAAESSIIARDIALAAASGVHLHICHVSCEASIEHIRAAKSRGQRITAEVTPHHLAFCADDIPAGNPNFKMSPPLRTRADMLALRKALADGVIDAIATDHAPHHPDEKAQGWENAPNGVIGLETAVGAALTCLRDHLTPAEIISKLTTNPAAILNIDRGHLSIGANADIAIIDPDFSWNVEPEQFASKAVNTPFSRLTGKVVHTIYNGEIVAYNGKLCK